MAQTTTEIATMIALAVKQFYESKTASSDKLVAAKAYTDTVIAGLQATIVTDNLNSTSATAALSAGQGKVLKTLIDNINTLISSDQSTLDTMQEVVDFITTNKSTLDNLAVANIAGLQAALNAKEPAITTKESGFNKPIGTGAGTLAAGNDARIVNAVTGTITQAAVNTLFTP